MNKHKGSITILTQDPHLKNGTIVPVASLIQIEIN
jgi:hypothetical protein